MTNKEMKKKIVEIIINAIWKDAEADYDSTDETEACSIADALIAAGIGDLKETEYCMKVMEKKYKIALTNYAKLHRKATRYNKMAATYDAEITGQAEKELAEEEKDE